MNKSDFNKKVAEWDGIDISNNKSCGERFYRNENGTICMINNYYDDLNQLLPVVWKMGIGLTLFYMDHVGIKEWVARAEKLEDCINEDPIQALRECVIKVIEGEKDEQ